MANDEQPQIRVRINIGRTASGKTTWDATVELERPMPEGDQRKFHTLTQDERISIKSGVRQVGDLVLSESNRLQRELNDRYPQDEAEGAA